MRFRPVCALAIYATINVHAIVRSTLRYARGIILISAEALADAALFGAC
jgi:hypothetical protein